MEHPFPGGHVVVGADGLCVCTRSTPGSARYKHVAPESEALLKAAEESAVNKSVYVYRLELVACVHTTTRIRKVP